MRLSARADLLIARSRSEFAVFRSRWVAGCYTRLRILSRRRTSAGYWSRC